MGFWCNRAVGIVRAAGVGAACLALANCTTDYATSRIDQNRTSAVSSRVLATGETAPKRTVSIRKHTIATTAHEPTRINAKYSAVGVASWYGADFHGRHTANGETFDMNSLSAAHPSLPLPCNVRVTNLLNHRSIVVRVNDRGPYVGGRVIDVSAKTAKVLGFYEDGLSKVKVEYVGRAQ